jgi:hypothetical protein
LACHHLHGTNGSRRQMTGRPPSPPPRSTTRQRSLPRTTVDDHAASLAVDRVNASEDEAHDQPHDACLLPSQPLTVEVLRRPLDSAGRAAGVLLGYALRGAAAESWSSRGVGLSSPPAHPIWILQGGFAPCNPRQQRVLAGCVHASGGGGQPSDRSPFEPKPERWLLTSQAGQGAQPLDRKYIEEKPRAIDEDT